MIEITLDSQDLYLASIVGVRRRIESMRRGGNERNGLDRKKVAEAWYYNVVGAMGELAAAKALNLHWRASVNAKKNEPDIGEDVQVRTLARGDYDLIVRPDDIDDHRYVLVTGDPPTFRVVGWMKGREAKANKEWLFDRGNRDVPVFWVPQKHLVPVVSA